MEISESDFVPSRRRLPATVKVHLEAQELDNMIASNDFTMIDKFVNKSVGYCDFEFTNI